MEEIIDLTPGLQCCLRCRRVLTNRTLHDALEEPVLASIGSKHPGWTGADGDCPPCVEEYRSLLSARQARSEQPVGQDSGGRSSRASKWSGSQAAAQRVF